MFIVALIVCVGFVLVLVFVMKYLVHFLVLHLDGEKRDGCFTLIVLLMSCDCVL